MKKISLQSIKAQVMKMFQSKATHQVPSIQNLEFQKYLGRWYEIGRLPKYEQRQLTHVTAYYHLDAKGILRVKNTGYRNGKKREICAANEQG